MKRSSWISLMTGVLILLVVGTGESQDRKREGSEEKKKAASVAGFGFEISRSPIDITSDTVEGDQKRQTVTFKGNVVVKQQDITIHSDSLVVYYDMENKKLQRIEAIGNVKVVQMDRRATSKKAVFDQEEEKVILDGDAVIREGNNLIRGERVTYYVREERSVVEGGEGSRVITTIVPPEKD